MAWSIFQDLFNSLKSLISMAFNAPHNFSWVEPNKLAGLALPRMTAEYQYLLDNGIKHLVCLCERKPPNHDTCPKLKLHHIKIPDFTAPSPSQIERFLSIVEEANSKGEGVAVHCMHGHGRTGTVLACYLVKTRKISGIDAIKEIRRLRHGSIETHEQEKAVVQFYQRTK
ncbi:dual specificity protein phosphatase 23b isoform X1 [Plectropomus leopardus]|uniref:dual specificity protein phosphatase 23b isoform X1 n=2 Tax=Plectropomus leopardus TaxID=160734 RepID=UPI001C4B110D|nr:dual specificity protein phosphatase 23b isoform X1 [Plectropomus leopardus]XP_042357061.1 dual specificity protein phosphatase 23b isoform X1 [Plectropomus leopardus]XP_042357062.1 dual specificity protein phosphatase 23b isoform X1 [Plectropomus leopardus]